MTRNQAAAQVRQAANAIIAQRERQAQGWDKGMYRDDDTLRIWTIRQAIQMHIQDAMDVVELAR